MPADPAAAKAIFLEAVAIEDPTARAALVDERCEANVELRARVLALLASNDRALMGEATASFGGDVENGVKPMVKYSGREENAVVVIANKYTLVEVIGEGGMGSVWRAKQTEPVKRFVAVKLIKAGMDSKSVLARFEAERQALALMDHPNIAKVLDGGLHKGRPYFVLELVKGIPITEYCDTNKLTPRDRLELFVQACQAIQHAHQKGIIHRDIKPSNVLVALYDDRPMVKVIDFGVAKATGGTLTEMTIDTGFGGVVGTPQYMSPEQATFNNLDIDTRSDVYSLGVLLYELLTGTPPFSRKELEKQGLLEILRVVREEEPPRPSTKLSTSDALPSLSSNRSTEPKKLTGLLRNELDWIVMKALEKNRTRRYETAIGFAADVQRYLAGEAVQAHPPSRSYRLSKFVRRNKGQVIAASLVLFSLVAGVVGTSLGLLEAHNQTERARDEANKKDIALAEETRQRKEAEAARAAETVAKNEADVKRKEAETNLTFAKKGNEILGSVFRGLDPNANYATVGELIQALTTNLKKAVEELDGSAIGDPLTVGGMQNVLGYSLMSLGDAHSAVVVFQKAGATFKNTVGDDHPHTLLIMHNLASAYQADGQVKKAIPLFEATLEKRITKLGEDHLDTLQSMNNLATAYHVDGQVKKALRLFERTLEKRKAKLKEDHSDRLESMNNLAREYQADGQVKKAIPLYIVTLEKLKSKHGEDHPGSLTIMNNLATAYQADRQLNKAIPLYIVTLDKRKIKLGEDHPDTLTSMNNLAASYFADGQVKKAIPLFEVTLEKRKAKLGEDHPDTLQSMNNLARAYQLDGQSKMALPLFVVTLEKRKAKLGENHPDTLRSMRNLASCYRSMRQIDKSVAMLENMLPVYEKIFGREHSETQGIVADLGVNYKDTGRVAESILLLKEAFTASKKHATLRWVGIPLLEAFIKAGNSNDSMRLIDELVADARKLFPNDSLQLAGELTKIGRILLDSNAFSQAEPLLRESLAIRERNEPDTWTTFNSQSLLGGTLLGQKKYADAEPLLLKGYEGMKAREKTIPPQGITRIIEALDRLIEYYTVTNKPDEAKKYRELRGKNPNADPMPR